MLFKKVEFNRKLVHLSAVLIPLAYYYINKSLLLFILATLFLFTLTLDIVRIKSNGNILQFYNVFFLRDLEKNKFSGAFYFLLSCIIGTILFSKYVFILSVSVLIVCDTVAALIGIYFGKHKIYNKSLEGTVAFFISGLVVVGILNYIFSMPIISKSVITAIFFTSVAELFSNFIKVNDNFLILLVFGTSYYLSL